MLKRFLQALHMYDIVVIGYQTDKEANIPVRFYIRIRHPTSESVIRHPNLQIHYIRKIIRFLVLIFVFVCCVFIWSKHISILWRVTGQVFHCKIIPMMIIIEVNVTIGGNIWRRLKNDRYENPFIFDKVI